MSIVSKLMSAISGRRPTMPAGEPSLIAKPSNSIPTVRFDPSLVSDAVKADLRRNIERLSDFNVRHFDEIYDAALISISRGRDMGMLTISIMKLNLPTMTKKRAAEISRGLNSKAAVIMDRERQMSLGIVYANWVYSGARCQVNPRKPSEEDIRQDALHKAVNGKRYEIAKGMFLDGRMTMPGWDEGCKCVSRPIVQDFEK